MTECQTTEPQTDPAKARRVRIVELQNNLGFKIQHQLYVIETVAGCRAEQMGAENAPARQGLLWLCEEGVRMARELRDELERLTTQES